MCVIFPFAAMFLVVMLYYLCVAGFIAVASVICSQTTISSRIYHLTLAACVTMTIGSLSAGMVGMTISASSGGYAYLGKIENGQHYVGNKGAYRPVSAERWKFLQATERILTPYWFLGGMVGVIVVRFMGIFGKYYEILDPGIANLLLGLISSDQRPNNPKPNRPEWETPMPMHIEPTSHNQTSAATQLSATQKTL